MTPDVATGAILEARARALAAPLRADEEGDLAVAAGALPALVFQRGGEQFAVPLDGVVDVRREATITPLPGVRAPVVGVTTWRGRVLTVIDPGAAATPPKTGQLVVVGEERGSYGLFADEAVETRVILAESLGHRTGMISTSGIPALGLTPDAVLVIDWLALRRTLVE